MGRFLSLPEQSREFDELDCVAWLKGMRNENFQTVIAIDPGDHHTGVTFGIAGAENESSALAWSCEMEPQACVELINDCVLNGWLDVVVAENFFLQRDKAMAQIGSPMDTARMLGKLEWIVTRSSAKWVTQHPSIKKTMSGLLRLKFQIPTPPPENLGLNSIHAKDSRLHFWYYALHYEGALP